MLNPTNNPELCHALARLGTDPGFGQVIQWLLARREGHRDALESDGDEVSRGRSCECRDILKDISAAVKFQRERTGRVG